jgi:cytochrome bd ubiquinol oxidase subunit II
MVELWFALVAFATAAYVVLDGYDLGAGAIHLFVAKTDDERRAVLGAIGPYWDGNEVWLLAIAGALFVAFPSVLAAAFSGMYLAMFMVLWAIALRGISIEMRGQSHNELWRALWDFVFAAASVGLVVLFGVALGNLLRGFPLDARGMVVLPLFADFTPSPPTGLLDWYTVGIAAFALAALVRHAALFVAWKTAGDLRARCGVVASRSAPAVAGLWVAAWATSLSVARLTFRPLAIVFAIAAFAALAASVAFAMRARFRAAFAASSAFLASILAGLASATFPTVLRSIDDKASVDAYAAAASPHALAIGSIWYLVGLAAVVFAFARQYRKADHSAEGTSKH